MSKIDLGTNQPDAVPTVRGRFYVKRNFGGITAAKWPRKRPNWRKAPRADWSVRFGFAAVMAANCLSIDLEVAINIARGSTQVPRDQLTAAALGRLWILENADGSVWGHVEGPTA